MSWGRAEWGVFLAGVVTAESGAVWGNSEHYGTFQLASPHLIVTGKRGARRRDGSKQEHGGEERDPVATCLTSPAGVGRRKRGGSGI